MTAFEQGYKAHMEGKDQYDNPFAKETAPYSCKQWLRGLAKSQKDHTK